ncbi:EAL domain-containing protein [Thiomonas sp.]
MKNPPNRGVAAVGAGAALGYSPGMPIDPSRPDQPASGVAEAGGRYSGPSVGPEFTPQWLDALPALFSYFDADCRLRQCNAAYANWLGRPVLDILGMPLDTLMDADAMAIISPHVQEALAGRTVLYAREQRQEREARWMEVRLQPAWESREPDLPPQVVGFYCLELDRSANKLQQDRASLLRHASGATFWTLDLQQGVLHSEQNWTNPSLREEPAHLTLAELLALVPETDRDGVLKGLQAVMRSGPVSPSVEARICRTDGSTIWTRSQGLVSRRSASGEPLELMGISVDISATKKALDDLRDSELRFRTFAELSSDWFWELDAEGRFTNLSASALRNRHVQQVREAVLGRQWQSLNPALAALPQWKALAALMQRQLPFHDLVLPFRSAGTNTRWWRLNGAPVRDAQSLLSGWRGVASDITEQREAEDKLYSTAYTDALTGLSNRTGFERLLEAALQEVRGRTQAATSTISTARSVPQRDGATEAASGPASVVGGALLFIDLDQFKQINDSLGHSMGDRVLAEAAQRIYATRRTGDLIGRFGGDEFLVYSRHVDAAANDPASEALAERLRADLARPYDLDGRILHTTVSVGVAQFPRDGRTIAELLSHADTALHEAKTQGRNRVQAFTPQLLAKLQRRTQLEAELHAALEQQSFRIALQPIARLERHAPEHLPAQRRYGVVGFEALARWTRPNGEEIGPAEFIPMIQDLGLISAFGFLIIRLSLQALRRLRDDCGYTGHMSVNVSPAQLKSGCVECLRDELAAAGIEPAALTIEITENQQVMSCPDCLLTLDTIRAMGVRVSLDDFGVGFSNLEYITRLPATQLKIDRTFTHGVAQDRYKAAVVTATLAMAASLGMDAVAEGVKDAADLRWIERAGCSQVQGWALWPAMDLDAACALLQATRSGP